jgi:UDP-glucose 4-epimerase
MTTLVTGAGLIGRLTAEILAGRGEAVVLADIRPPAALPASPKLVFAQCDVTDEAGLDALIKRHGVRRAVHTAAMLSTGIRANPLRGVQVNVMGTATLLDCARRHGLSRVVCASSATVGYTTFGRHGPAPIEEDLPLHLLSERPASIYAMSKIAGEHLACLYHDLYGLDVVSLRYAAVLGPSAEPPSSVPGRLLAHLFDGARSGKRVALDDAFMIWGGREEFVDARDCAAANVHALDAAEPKQRVYNVAPGDWHSLAEFVACVRAVHPGLEVDLPPESDKGFAGFPHLRPAPSDVSGLARELGFGCRYRLEETIRHVWEQSAAP